MRERKCDLLQLATAKAVTRALDDIGVEVGCIRLSPMEKDRAYAWRLGIHVMEQCLRNEELLDRILSLSRFPTNSEQPPQLYKPATSRKDQTQ